MDQNPASLEPRGALHILNGHHAGVVVELNDFDHLSVGSGVDNDIILADDTIEAQHAQFKRDKAGWRILASAAVTRQNGLAIEPETWNAADGALRLGNIWLALVPEGGTPPDLASIEHGAPAMGVDSGEQESALHDEGSAMVPPTLPASPPKARRPARWRRLPMVLVPVLLLPAGLLLGMTQRPGTSPSEAVIARPLPELDPALAKLLQAPRWRDLKATPQEDGRAVIHGWLPDEGSLEALSMQLARVKPRPILRIRTDDGTREAVKTLVTELAPGLHSEYAKNGHVVLSGAAADEQSVDGVVARLKKQIPELNVKTEGIEYLPTVVDQLQKTLEAEKIAGVRASWDGRQVKLTGTVSPVSEARLQTLLQAFDQRYRSAIPFEATLTRDLGRYGTGLPFAIRSVVGGNAPYIVLEDGTMLTPGGTYAGWRLKDVDATNLTFDAPQLLVVKR